MDRPVIKQNAKQVVRRAIGEPYVGKRLKLRRLQNELPRLLLQPSAILDAGTEDATFVYWLADCYPTAGVTAVDIDQNAIAVCIKARPAGYDGRVTFRVAPFDQLEREAYDLITVFDVLEHIRDDVSAMRELARALKPQGTVLVHVPRDQWTTRSGLVHRYADEDAWQINPGHVRQGYSPEGIGQLLERSGLEVEDIQTWLGRWGVLAHTAYQRLERPLPLRLLSVPITDLCAWLDVRGGTPNGNTVFARAVKPA